MTEQFESENPAEQSPSNQPPLTHNPDQDYWDGVLQQIFTFDELHISQKVLTLSQKYKVLDENNEPRFYVVRPPHLRINMVLGVLGFIVRIVILYTAFQMIIGQQNFIGGILFLMISNFILGVAFTLAAPYRHIEIYRDESMDWRLLTITQDNKIGIYRNYTLHDIYGNPVAIMQRNVFASMFRRDWWITDPEGDFLTRVREDSLIKSLLRRYLGPLYGLLRTNFNFEDENYNAIGVYDRKLTLRDQYHLKMADQNYPIDRRICLAMSILLDTAESR